MLRILNVPNSVMACTKHWVKLNVNSYCGTLIFATLRSCFILFSYRCICCLCFNIIHNSFIHMCFIPTQLLDPAVNKDTMRPMDSFRVIAENFFASGR